MRDELGLNGGGAINKKKILMVLIGAAVLIIISFITIFSGGSDDEAKEAQKAGELAPIQDFEQMNQGAAGQPAPAVTPDTSVPGAVPGAPAEDDYTQLCRDKFESEYRAAGFEPKDYPDKAEEYIKACIDFIQKNK